MGEHRAVIGAVADRNCFRFADAQQRLYTLEHISFGVVEHHLSADQTAQYTFSDMQRVGKVRVKSEDISGMRCRVAESSAENNDGVASLFEFGNGLFRTRHKGKVVADLIDFLLLQTSQQCHTGGQTLEKVEFSLHRAFGNFRNFLFQSQRFCQEVDCFAVHQCGIEIKYT